jgi:predicted regulator of amino acid metabolism with ACT domain
MEIGAIIYQKLKDRPSQLKVVRLLFEYGLCVKSKKVYAGDIEISATALATAAEVDRRVIPATIYSIINDPKLSLIFKNLHPTANFKEAAKSLGWHVVSVTISKSKDRPGVLATVMRLISDAGINIKQVIVDDVEEDTKKAYIITESALPGRMYAEIMGKEIVDAITIH